MIWGQRTKIPPCHKMFSLFFGHKPRESTFWVKMLHFKKHMWQCRQGREDHSVSSWGFPESTALNSSRQISMRNGRWVTYTAPPSPHSFHLGSAIAQEELTKHLRWAWRCLMRFLGQYPKSQLLALGGCIYRASSRKSVFGAALQR